MDLGLKERVSIVGGSSKGMGKATALALAREGAFVTICARTETDLRMAELEIAKVATQQHILAIPADLSKIEDIKRVVRDTINRFERIDILVNNIGGPPTGKATELEEEKWHSALEQNFLSTVHMSQEVIPYMKQQRWGRIINVLSSSVKQPINGLVLSTASRLAVIGFAKTLSTEVAPFNITVNNVLPGSISTGRMTSLFQATAREQGRTEEEIIKEATQKIPMRRLGDPREMGDLITFLASERTAYITGESISANGGSIVGTL